MAVIIDAFGVWGICKRRDRRSWASSLSALAKWPLGMRKTGSSVDAMHGTESKLNNECSDHGWVPIEVLEIKLFDRRRSVFPSISLPPILGILDMGVY